MKRLMDIHTHAVASGHAYSTVDENLRWAAEQGLQLVALTDHAPAMKDTTCHAYFANLHVLPEMLHGVRLLKGIELNILDFDGTIDMDEAVLQRLDLAIASLHMPCIKPGTKKENTQVFLKVMENPYVDIIGHADDPSVPCDFEAIVQEAQHQGKLLELNNNSTTAHRPGSLPSLKQYILCCKAHSQRVCVASDAHFDTMVGNVAPIMALLDELEFPQQLIVNLRQETFEAYLREREARIGSR